MMEAILKAVSEITGISTDDMLSRKRDAETSEARQIFMYLSKNKLHKTNSSIAVFLNRYESGISMQIADFNKKIKIYKALSKKVDDIKNAII